MKKTLLLITTLFTIITSFFVCPIYAEEDDERYVRAEYIELDSRPTVLGYSTLKALQGLDNNFNSSNTGFSLIFSIDSFSSSSDAFIANFYNNWNHNFVIQNDYIGLGQYYSIDGLILNHKYEFSYFPDFSASNDHVGTITVKDLTVDNVVYVFYVDNFFTLNYPFVLFAYTEPNGHISGVYTDKRFYEFSYYLCNPSNRILVNHVLPYYDNETGFYGFYDDIIDLYNCFISSYSGEIYVPDEPEPFDPENPEVDTPVVPSEDDVVPSADLIDTDDESWLERANDTLVEWDSYISNASNNSIGNLMDEISNPISTYLESFNTGFFSGQKFIGDILKTPYATIIDKVIDGSDYLTWLFNATCGVSALIILLGGFI